ncbi:DUF4286 family protein [Jiangella asiatica]|uniref:Uncharacterized protein n=1 Tax=Jiangella asiatica TaxID=2530372 RepID=A0A4R5DMB3_9ACTN|nr:DUF4286 family protein [Jiangella asiatica]TDE11813.1 hypothetical protein E1269_08600 [Jiangella asiatica]
MTRQRRAGLLLVMMEPEPGHENDLNRWYDEEHLAERLAVPGITSARRFRALQGGPRYLALYDLDGPDVVASPAYLERKRHPTPWTRRVEAHVTIVRNVYVEITAVPAGEG